MSILVTPLKSVSGPTKPHEINESEQDPSWPHGKCACEIQHYTGCDNCKNLKHHY